MSCHRVSRELLERIRFGELDRRSAPHIDHLAGCARCQEEVGIDRALIRQLRRALAERVEDSEPSPMAFAAVRERALREEADQLPADDDTSEQVVARADKARYLREKLDERARAEREHAEHRDEGDQALHQKL